MALTRDEILAVKDYEHIDVPVPEWGEGEVCRVRAVNGHGRTRYEKFFSDAVNTAREQAKAKGRELTDEEVGTVALTHGLRGFLLCLTICDEEGNAIFSESDADAIETKNGEVVGRLFDAAAKLNGLTVQTEEQAGNG